MSGLARAGVVARRILTQLRRDRRTLALILVQPIIIMGVFGYAFGGDVTDAHVAVANLDRGTFAAKVLEKLDAEIVIVVPYETSAAAQEALRGGDVAMAVVFPANFTRNFESPPQEERIIVLEVYQDLTSPQLTAAALGAFSDAMRYAIENETGRPAGFSIQENVVFGEEDGKFLQFFVPGIASFAIFQLGSLLTVVTIVKERTQGTLARLIASPLRRWEIVGGYASAFTVLSVVQAAAILAIAVFVFRVDVRGSLLLALLITTVVGVVALGFGILVSGLAKTEFQAVQAVFLLSFPNLFLAGIFAPVESMPAFVRPASRFVPLTYAVDALRETLNRGREIGDVAPALIVLMTFAVVFLGLATISFGRKG